MRLLVAAFSLLVWRAAHAVPSFGHENAGPLVVERASPSGQFVDSELQFRSSRFLDQATTGKLCSPNTISTCHACLTRISFRCEWQLAP